MRSIIQLCFLTLLLLNAKGLKATHIVGGELYYEHLGNNVYRITFDYYLDCLNGSAGAISGDRSAWFVFFDGNTNERIASLDRNIIRSLPTRVSDVNYKCITNKPNACVDRYQYRFEVTLPPRDGGYIVAYQRCCRNNSITNLLDPGDQGATYWTKIEDLRTDNWKNSSAIFKKLPPNFLCTNAPLVFDHSASDADGDSLAYELYLPFNSFRGTSGATNGKSAINRPQPDPVDYMTPPFTNIVWAAGYGVANQIDAFESLIINPITGSLKFTPTKAGQYVVGILVREYRNGKLVGTTRRDFQFNVSNCTFEVVSSFFAPVKSCGFRVQFTNRSSSSSTSTSLSYHWDFGDPNTSSDTSNDLSPSYTYERSGNYVITLVAKTSICADTYRNAVNIVAPIFPNLGPNDTACLPINKTLDAGINSLNVFWNTGAQGRSINVSEPGMYIATHTTQGCSFTDSVIIYEDLNLPDLLEDTIFCNNESINFPIAIKAGNYVSINWNTLQTTPNIIIDKVGLYTVSVQTIYGCNYADSINVEQQMPPSLNLKDTSVCPNLDANFDAGARNNITYLWSTGQTTSSITCIAPGKYYVKIFDGKCANYDTAILSNFNLGPYGLPKDTAFCDRVWMELKPGNQFKSYQWNTGATSATIIATERGKYTVTLISNEDCIAKDSINIGLNPLPFVNFGPDTTICIATILTLDAGEAVSYLWQDGSTNRTIETIDSGVYYVQVMDDKGCFSGDSIRIAKNPNALPSDLFMPNAFSPNGDGKNDIYPDNQFQDIGVEYNLKIFTRWGEKMIDYDSPTFNWDGTYKGKVLPQGVYIYLIHWIGCDNIRRTKDGNITLMK